MTASEMAGPAGPQPLRADELAAEQATALPDKEVVSLLDLNADLDLALDVAAPVDLAVAANANVAAPIDAAVSANVLSTGSTAVGAAHQDVVIDQGISGDAIATAPQDSTIDQGAGAAGATTPDAGTAAGTAGAGAGAAIPTVPAAGDASSLLDGDLLDVDVNLAADANLTAPIAGAVAANANVAAPIDASVAANIGSVGSQAAAVADQNAVITQHLDDVTAEATADQTSDIQQ